MKTKTIYHLNHDCDKIVKIEVRQKSNKKKKRPVVVNLERLVGELQLDPPPYSARASYIEKAFNKANKCQELKGWIKQSQNENPHCAQEVCLSSSHNLAELSQNKEIVPLQLPEMLLCSEAYQNFVNLLGRLSPLDAEKQIYSMFLARIPLMEQEVCRTEQKASPASASGWRKNFQFD